MTDETENLGRTMWFFVVDDEDRVRRFPLKRWSRFHRNQDSGRVRRSHDGPDD